MNTLLADFRYGFRSLLSQKAFALTALLTLAVGIGGNTAIFSLVYGVLLRPLDYPEPDRVMTVWEDHTRRDGPRNEWTSPPGFEDWVVGARAFTDMAAMVSWTPTLTGDGEPERLRGASVSESIFRVLGVSPVLGRGFTPEEDRPGAPTVVVISHGLWQRRFGGDPAIVGQSIRLNGTAATVVGVMPADFRFPIDEQRDVLTTWRPFLSTGCLRGCYTQRVLARLAPGVTVEAARQQMSDIGRRIELEYPETNRNVGVTVTPLHEYVVGSARDGLVALLAAVGMVLLIVCANVAGLLLVRAVGRSKEVAIRSALGASRLRIIRQLAAESVGLAAAGGALGIVFGYWLLDLLRNLAPPGTPRLDQVTMDVPVLLFAFVISAVTGLACGLLPAVQASRFDIERVLRSAGAAGRGATAGSRWRSGLVVAEVALALVLLASAGLLVRSFSGLLEVDPGFDPDHVMTARLGLPSAAYPDGDRIRAFQRELGERLNALPGVRSAALSTSVPMTGLVSDTVFLVEGRPAPSMNQRPVALFSMVSPGFFETMRIPVVDGRTFSPVDDERSASVVIVNETLARQQWPGERAVGKRIGGGGDPVTWREVIGVVGDVKHTALGAETRPTMYFASLQLPRSATNVVLRVDGDPLSITPALRREINAIDPDLAISGVSDLTSLVRDTVAVPRILALMFSAFAVTALLLTALGLYGVMAYSVSQRVREIGIRTALGAGSAEVLRLVLRRGLQLVAGGVAIGLVAAYAAGRGLASLLFGVTPADPVTLAVSLAALAVVAGVACAVPAWRALRVDPLVALRSD